MRNAFVIVSVTITTMLAYYCKNIIYILTEFIFFNPDAIFILPLQYCKVVQNCTGNGEWVRQMRERNKFAVIAYGVVGALYAYAFTLHLHMSAGLLGADMYNMSKASESSRMS